MGIVSVNLSATSFGGLPEYLLALYLQSGRGAEYDSDDDDGADLLTGVTAHITYGLTRSQRCFREYTLYGRKPHRQ